MLCASTHRLFQFSALPPHPPNPPTDDRRPSADRPSRPPRRNYETGDEGAAPPSPRSRELEPGPRVEGVEQLGPAPRSCSWSRRWSSVYGGSLSRFMHVACGGTAARFAMVRAQGRLSRRGPRCDTARATGREQAGLPPQAVAGARRGRSAGGSPRWTSAPAGSSTQGFVKAARGKKEGPPRRQRRRCRRRRCFRAPGRTTQPACCFACRRLPAARLAAPSPPPIPVPCSALPGDYSLVRRTTSACRSGTRREECRRGAGEGGDIARALLRRLARGAGVHVREGCKGAARIKGVFVNGEVVVAAAPPSRLSP